MAYRLLEEEPIKEQPKSESLPARIGRNIVRTGANILSIPGNIQQTIEYIKGSPLGPQLPGLESPKLPTLEKFAPYLPEGYAKPRGSAEEILDTTIQNLPLTYLLGPGSFGTKLARDVIGTTAMKGIEKAGGGPILQTLGGIGAGIGASKIKQGLRGSVKNIKPGSIFSGIKTLLEKGEDPKTLQSIAETAEKQFYDKERELGSKINQSSPKFNEKITSLYNQVSKSKALSEDQRNNLLKKIELIHQDILPGNVVNASKLSQTNKELNELYSSFRGPKEQSARKTLDYLQKIVLETGKDIGSKNKKWYKAWQAGNSIHKALNYRPKLLNILDQYPKFDKFLSNKFVPIALGLGGTGLGGYIGGLTGAAAGAAGGAALGSIAGKATQITGFLGDPVTEKLLAQAFKNTVKEQIPALASTLNKLNKHAETYEKKYKKSNPQFRLIED